MNRHSILAAICAAIALVVSLHPVAAAKPPRRVGVTVNGAVIEIERASAGARVLLVGYESRIRGNSPVSRRLQRELIADASGAARLELPERAAPRSLWVAFDLTTGAYGASALGDRGLRELELPERYLKREGDGRLKKLAPRLAFVHIVTIRPGHGVWELTAGDGGEGDSDGALNGVVSIAAEQLRKVGQTRADADEFRDDDIVAIFVPHQLGYLITEVKK